MLPRVHADKFVDYSGFLKTRTVSKSDALPDYVKFGPYACWRKDEVSAKIEVVTHFDPDEMFTEKHTFEKGVLVKYERKVEDGPCVEIWYQEGKPSALRHTVGGRLTEGVYPAICVWEGDSIAYIEIWARGVFKCSVTFGNACIVRYGENISYLARSSEHMPRFALPRVCPVPETPNLLSASKAREQALEKQLSMVGEINDLISRQVQLGCFSAEWECLDAKRREVTRSLLTRSGYGVSEIDNGLAITW